MKAKRDPRRISKSPSRTVVLCKDGLMRTSTAHFDMDKPNNGSTGTGVLLRVPR